MAVGYGIWSEMRCLVYRAPKMKRIPEKLGLSSWTSHIKNCQIYIYYTRDLKVPDYTERDDTHKYVLCWYWMIR